MATPAYQQRPTTELAHLAWCLLVALRMEQHDGRATSDVQQHLFIMRWLANAQKHKRFPRSVAADILWLQAQGKLYGFRANSHAHFHRNPLILISAYRKAKRESYGSLTKKE